MGLVTLQQVRLTLSHRHAIRDKYDSKIVLQPLSRILLCIKQAFAIALCASIHPMNATSKGLEAEVAELSLALRDIQASRYLSGEVLSSPGGLLHPFWL